MKTTEKNKLIADFMGMKAKQRGPGTPLMYDNPTNSFKEVHPSCLEFDSSWDWLMQVVEKIEQTETKDGRTFTIDMHKNNVIINQYGKYNNVIIVGWGDTRIESLYNACVEFVKWYNKKQINGLVGSI